MLKFIVGLILSCWAAILMSAEPARAQFVVASCGSLPTAWVAGQQSRPFIFDLNGRLCASTGASNQVAANPTVQAAAYASGNCVGGFVAATVSNSNGQSGFLTNVRVASIGGATPTLTVYLFSSNPSASTCTDRSTFTLNAADVDKIIAAPTAITLAAPTGTTITFASADYTPARPFIAGGSAASGVKTIYYALVSGSSFTPAAATDLHVRVGVALN